MPIKKFNAIFSVIMAIGYDGWNRLIRQYPRFTVIYFLISEFSLYELYNDEQEFRDEFSEVCYLVNCDIMSDRDKTC